MTLTLHASKTNEEQLYIASPWRLVWWKFLEHRVAVFSGLVVATLYLLAIFAPFVTPYDPQRRNIQLAYVPPQGIQFADENGWRFPFTYGLRQTTDPQSYRRTYADDPNKKFAIRFFVHGDKYALWNLIESDLHLIGVDEGGTLFLFGTDQQGRDMFSRTIYAAQISLSVGLLGVLLSLILGLVIGGISGYYGGRVDFFIQRFMEILRSFPAIPLWMALSAAMPPGWSPVAVYFGITIILSFIGWTGLGRVVRGRVLALKGEDFILAARFSGARTSRIIERHLIPSITSHIIASVTLHIPGMILGETSLSFLGIGLRPPVISWGVLLQQAQNLNTVMLAPWLLIPGIFIIITVLAFNFLGDGLRDAADPYSTLS